MNAIDLVKEIESRLIDLGNQVESARNGEEMLSYLKFLSKFHRYSFHNTLSIWSHCPEATYVLGFKGWQKLGRYVLKGQSAIPILIPITVKCDDSDDDDGGKRIIQAFKVGYVFDISQTGGKALPEAPITISGNGLGLLTLIEHLAASHGIHVEYVKMDGDCHGISYGGRVEVRKDLDEAGKVSVLLHELAHEALHKGEQREGTTKQQRETEAEAVSFIVSTHFGLESKAANYLALWDANKEVIIQSFRRIHTVAADFVQAIEVMKGGEVIDEGCA